MKILIIEDEIIAANRLKKMLAEISPSSEVVGVTGSVADTVSWLHTQKADLILADIHLSDGLCFEIFEQVVVKTPVIFITAYDQYTIRAFKVNSIAYLLKPVIKEDLAEGLKKFSEMKAAFMPDLEQLISQFTGNGPGYKKRFLIQYGEKIRKVEADEVAYFYAMDKSVFLKTFQDKDYPLDYTLDKLEASIDPGQFFRINRKMIISMKSIANMTAWSRSRVKIDLSPSGGMCDEAIVSVERANDFRKWLS